MILENICFLVADSARSKAYLQVLIKNDMMPAHCIVYCDNVQEMTSFAENYQESFSDKSSAFFNLNEPVLHSIQNANISYEIINTKDINSEQMVQRIQKRVEKYMIYSGYGGTILKDQLFQIGKKFLHIHAGILPQYRGSTTAYYSYLTDKEIGATAIFLSEGIDEGEIIVQQKFEVCSGVNMDYVYEPWVRSQVLLRAIKCIIKNELKTYSQDDSLAETYYIIHPVLKHIAILCMERRIKD